MSREVRGQIVNVKSEELCPLWFRHSDRSAAIFHSETIIQVVKCSFNFRRA